MMLRNHVSHPIELDICTVFRCDSLFSNWTDHMMRMKMMMNMKRKHVMMMMMMMMMIFANIIIVLLL